MIIKNNMSAVNAHRVSKFNSWELDKSISRISSGDRISKSADDASGLAVSEKMRTQIRGLRQAERNTENGISFVQTADSFLEQTSSILQRIRELSIQAANGIYSSEDRTLMQVEVSQLVDEVDRLSSQAEFNRFKIFLGDFARGSKTASMWFHMGPNMNQRRQVYISTMTAKSLKVDMANVGNVNKANETIGLVDNALNMLNKTRADLGSYSNRLEITAKGLFAAYENIQAAESRIRDTDIAEEVINYTAKKLLENTSIAMLSQANLRGQTVLRLLN